MLLTGVLNSLSSSAKQLIVKKFPRYKQHVPYCCKIQVHQHAFTLLKSIYSRWSISASIQLHIGEWVGDLSCSRSLFSFCLSLSFFQCLFPLPFPFSAFPADTCRRAHTSREPTSEKCNLSISAPQRKDKQCWKKNEGDKHAAELMLDKHVALPPIHKWPCHVRRSQVWKFKDKLDCARGRCCCFWVCLPVVLAPLKWQQRDGCS